MSENNGNGKYNKDDDLDWSKVTPLTSITESRCKICQSPFRMEIDRMLAIGYSHRVIADELINRDPEFKGKKHDTVRRNISRHNEEHCEVRQKVMRRVLEKRAIQEGLMIDELETAITTGEAFLDLLIQRGVEHLENPDWKVRMDTVVEAVKMQQDMKRAEYQARVEDMQKQMFAVSQAIKEVAKAFDIPDAFYAAVAERAKEIYATPDVLQSTAEVRQIEDGRGT